MAISSIDKLVAIKSFALSNPLPLDSREIYDTLEAAREYAATSATAYAGQTIKVVENGTVTAYNLIPSLDEGVNYTLSFVAGGEGGGVQNVTTSAVEGNIKVSLVEGDGIIDKDVPVVGALINPVVDEVEHTLTLTKVGLDVNTEVVIPLGGASPETIISKVEKSTDGLTIEVTSFDVESEQSTTESITIHGAVTGIQTDVAGVISTLIPNADGEEEKLDKALTGAVINAKYDAETSILTLPVVTGLAEDGSAITSDVTVDFKTVVANAYTNVTATADTETESAKYTFSYKDATGAEQSTTVYETGVRKVEAGADANHIKVVSADTTGALSSTEILIGAGSVQNPTYEAENRKITLPILQADGTTQNLEINLGKDMVVKSGSYNTETQEIELVMTDDSVVKIPAVSLVDVYTGDATATASVSVSDTNVITAEVKKSTIEKNILKSDENGLYVVESDFADTKQLIVDAEAAANAYTDAQILAATPVWVDFGN